MQPAEVLEREQVAPAAIVQVSSEIRGWGMAVPQRIVRNDHFAAYLDTSDEWIRDRTGISQRRWCDPAAGASELAAPACEAAIVRAGLRAQDIDAIICATVTPDFIFPSTACVLQRRLGVARGFAFDVNAVCSGFVYALSIADAMIARGQCSNVLVVGVDVFSSIINPNDRSTCILFGDEAGAVVLSRAAGVASPRGIAPAKPVCGSARSLTGIYGSLLRAEGAYGDLLMTACGSARRPTPETLAEGAHFLTMAGKEIFKLAVRDLSAITAELVESAGLSLSDVDHFVSHQANKRILAAMARQLDLPEERVLANVDRYGNTSAASVPILFCEAVEAKTIKPGDLVLMSAFGGGITYASLLVRV